MQNFDKREERSFDYDAETWTTERREGRKKGRKGAYLQANRKLNASEYTRVYSFNAVYRANLIGPWCAADRLAQLVERRTTVRVRVLVLGFEPQTNTQGLKITEENVLPLQ